MGDTPIKLRDQSFDIVTPLPPHPMPPIPHQASSVRWRRSALGAVVAPLVPAIAAAAPRRLMPTPSSAGYRTPSRR